MPENTPKQMAAVTICNSTFKLTTLYRLSILMGCFAAAYAQPAAPTLTTLYSFQGGSSGDGAYPQGLVQDNKGVLYGNANYGGSSGFYGAIFSLTPPGTGQTQWTETVLHSFQATNYDGVFPVGTLVLDSSGALYGVTQMGGANVAGTVFQLLPPSRTSTQWTENIIYNFNSSDVYYPSTGLIFDPSGNLYGATADCCSLGASGGVFRLSPPSSPGGPWTETTLYRFSDGADGERPVNETLLLDGSGNLYGTTIEGGIAHAQQALGTVFELSPPIQPGGQWTETYYDFPNAGSGFQPDAGLVMDAKGILYGTTTGGASGPNSGTVFQLARTGDAGQPWEETVLHVFNGTDGYHPQGPVAFDKQGNLYGTTGYGGDEVDCGGCGTIFKLLPPTAPGGAWRAGGILKFNGVNGANPIGNLIIAGDGTLYGVTFAGGLYGWGAVYQVERSAGLALQ